MTTFDGLVATDRLADELHITKGTLADESGLSRNAVSKPAHLMVQARLRDVAEIIDRVLPWAGTAPQAFAWYRAQPLPSFGNRTAGGLVKEGRAAAVKRYLRRIAVGVCA